jgi:putative endonuclease
VVIYYPEGKVFMPRFHVYILECADGTYYTGYTNDLEKRLSCHNSGAGSRYTRSRLPVRIVWSKPCRNKHYAMSQEARIKNLPRKAKESLIAGAAVSEILPSG